MRQNPLLLFDISPCHSFAVLLDGIMTGEIFPSFEALLVSVGLVQI